MASVAVINGTIKGALALTPDSANDVDVRYSEALYVVGAGNLVLKCADDSIVTLPVPAYSTVQIRIKRLYATTTCTGIFGLRYEV